MDRVFWYLKSNWEMGWTQISLLIFFAIFDDFPKFGPFTVYGTSKNQISGAQSITKSRDQHKKPGFKDLYKVYQNKRAMNNNKQEFQKNRKGAEKNTP